MKQNKKKAYLFSFHFKKTIFTGKKKVKRKKERKLCDAIKSVNYADFILMLFISLKSS